MANMVHAHNLKESKLYGILRECLQDFPEIRSLREEQETCLVNLANRKDIFAVLFVMPFAPSTCFQRLCHSFWFVMEDLILVLSE